MADQTVRAVLTEDSTLSGEFTTPDGVALVATDKVLVTDQNDPLLNVIYTVVSGGAWTQTTGITYTSGMDVRVLEGNTYGMSRWVLISLGTITPGSTAMVWELESRVPQSAVDNGIEETGGVIQLPLRTDVQGETDVGPLTLSLTDRGVVESISASVGQEMYIEGFIPSYHATNPIFSAGAAWVPGASGVLEVPSDQNGPVAVLPSADFMYFYLQPTSGAPNVAGFTTAPAAPYQGTARNKTGDTNSRYICALRTNAGGTAFYNFLATMFGDKRLFIRYLEDTTASPFRVVTSSAATTNTTVNLGTGGSKLVPPTSKLALLRVSETAAVNAFFDNSEANLNPAGGVGIEGLAGNRDKDIIMPLDSNQSFRFAHSAGGGSLTIDVLGYWDRR